MDKAHVRIHVQPMDNSIEHAQDFAIDLDSPLISDIMDPVDHECLAPSRGVAPVYFTSQRNRKLLGTREVVATRLANIFTEKIMEGLCAKDTIQGYSQKEWKEIHTQQVISPSQLYYICKIYPEMIESIDADEEYAKVEDKSWWEIAARTINKIIQKKEKV